MSEPEKIDLKEWMSVKFQEMEARIDARIGRLEVKVNFIVGGASLVFATVFGGWLAHYFGMI